MKRLRHLLRTKRSGSERGQSLTEIAIFLPIFILIISGIVEMGYFMNRYLNLLDASREAARYGADLDPVGTAISTNNPSYNPAYNHNSPAGAGAIVDCSTTQEFYTAVACYAEQSFPEDFDFGNGYDDIVISAFTIKDGRVCNGYRWPDYMDGTSDRGWSYMGNQSSQFSNARVESMMANAPSQGLLILEMFYRHRQALGLPFFTIFVPLDIGIHTYTIMPNPTAGSYSRFCP
jgi:hypothetical protein